MGRDIVAAGLLGIVAVILVTVCHAPLERALTWPRRYVRARGYEHGLARHTARAILEELERVPDYRTATLPRLEVEGEPPWGELEGGAAWQSDLEREGRPLPPWAAPDADRVAAYGFSDGSSGADYGHAPQRPGVWPAPAVGTGDAGHTPAIDFTDLGPLTDNWARLVNAWADGSAAPSVTLEGTAAASSPEAVPVGQPDTAPGRDPIPGPDDEGAPSGPGAASSGPGWAPTRLGTLFDAVLAAEVSSYIQDQNRDVTLYLEQLLGVRW